MPSNSSATDWGWSRRTSILLRIATISLTAATFLASTRWRLIAERGLRVYFVPLAVPLGLFMIFTLLGLRSRYKDRVRGQSARDSAAAELAQRVHRGEIGSFGLYLRPFDWTRMFPIRNPDYKPSDDPLGELPVYDLEELMARGLSRHIPLFALGWPGEAIGAGRFTTEDSTWQDDVRTIANMALLVLVLPLFSRSTIWELGLIRDEAWLDKTVLIMPPQTSPFPQSLLTAGVNLRPLWKSADFRFPITTQMANCSS